MPALPSPDPAGWDAARRRIARIRFVATVVWTVGFLSRTDGHTWRSPRGIAVYAGIVVAIGAASAVFGDLVVARRFGVVRESPADWLRRRLKAAAFATAFVAVTVGPLPWAMAWWPRHWWLPMTLWLAAAWLVWTALIPAVVLPQLLDIRPLPAGPVADALAELAAKAARPLPVAVWHLADRSSAVQAIVVGLGPTQRLLVTDTLLAALAPAEVAGVVAHELSHVRRHDLLRRGTALTVGLGTVLATAATVTTGTAWDLPILALVSGLVALGYYRFLRVLELRADRDAVDLTGDRDAYRAALHRIATANGEVHGANRSSGFWQTHPGLSQRLAALDAEG